MSLVPICVGVALACAGDLHFDITGLLAALTSALSQTLMNISIKSVKAKYEYSGIQAFLGMTILCSLLTLPMLLAVDSKISSLHSSFVNGDSWPMILTGIASLAYHIEYALNFIFVGYVSSVTFSVSDIARRICIITVGSVMFNKALTSMNWVGIVIAICGVLWYTYLESQRQKQKQKQKFH